MKGGNTRMIVLIALLAMTGCGKWGNSAHSPAAGRAGSDDALPGSYAVSGLDALRIKTDAARSRLWVLGLNDVRVYDAVTKKLIQQIVLPSWSVMRFVCDPDLALDRSGFALVSSNVQAKLWRIDADSFEVKVHEISLHGKEQWEIGFGALAFTPDGALYALTSSAGSLWKIDVGNASARMIKLDFRLLNVCDLTASHLIDFERRKQPWTRPARHPN